MTARYTTPVEARELLDGIPTAGFEYVADVEVGESRWHELRELIVRDVETDQLYASGYEVGLTENQEGDRWEFTDKAEFVPVRERVEVIEVTHYDRVDR